MQPEPGTLSLGRGGALSLSLAGENYPLTRDDIHTLLFYGQSVPLTRTEETTHPSGAASLATVIDGHISVHASGRAVLATTRTGHYALPFASFQRVARGEAASAPLFPAVPGATGGVV